MVWRFVLWMICCFYGMGAAMTYGGIWQIQARPMEGVEVVLNDGLSIKGALTRDWNKDWVVTTADGSKVRFTDFQAMSFPAPAPLDGGRGGFFEAWRETVPVLVTAWVFLGLALASAFNGHLRFRARKR